MIRQAPKGTGYDNEGARELLREAGVQAFRKQAGYVPMVDTHEIPHMWKFANCVVAHPRDWRKELFNAVHPVSVDALARSFCTYLLAKGHDPDWKRTCQFINSIIKQNRKFVDHEAA